MLPRRDEGATRFVVKDEPATGCVDNHVRALLPIESSLLDVAGLRARCLSGHARLRRAPPPPRGTPPPPRPPPPPAHPPPAPRPPAPPRHRESLRRGTRPRGPPRHRESLRRGTRPRGTPRHRESLH